MADHWFSMGYVTYEKKNYCTCNEKAKIRPQELHRESGFREGAQTDTVREESQTSTITQGQGGKVKAWDDWSTMPNEFENSTRCDHLCSCGFSGNRLQAPNGYFK